jgi:hypothetical protein
MIFGPRPKTMNVNLIACIEPWNFSPWDYARKYKRAADELLLAVAERNLPIDTVAHPIAFLYRHALELAIKGFVATVEGLESGAYKSPCRHNLSDLWGKAKPLVDRNFHLFSFVEKPKLKCRLEAIDRIVNQISQHDPESFAFRYTTTKDHQPILKDLKEFDFNTFAAEVENAMHLLGGMTDNLLAALQSQC